MQIFQVAAFLLLLIAFSVKFDKKLVEVLPVTLCVEILLLYVLAFFKALSFVDVVGIALILACIIYIIRLNNEDRKTLFGKIIDKLNDPSWWVFVVMMILIYIGVKEKLITWWDDLNFWGTDVKAIFYDNGFAGKYLNVAPEFGDYPPGTQPLAIHFLRRNRIIAGLSRATILAESRIRGGGMMTARLAASYDREVFAIPGNIDCAQSQGCNLLIREKVAEPITDIGEFVLSLGYAPPRLQTVRDVETAVRQAFEKELPPEQVSALVQAAALVKRRRDITAEELARAAGTDYARAAALLGRLEAAGFARADLLGRYRIVRQ